MARLPGKGNQIAFLLLFLKEVKEKAQGNGLYLPNTQQAEGKSLGMYGLLFSSYAVEGHNLAHISFVLFIKNQNRRLVGLTWQHRYSVTVPARDGRPSPLTSFRHY